MNECVIGERTGLVSLCLELSSGLKGCSAAFSATVTEELDR